MKSFFRIFTVGLAIVLSIIANKSYGQTGVEISLSKAFICPMEQLTLSVKNYDDRQYPSIYLQFSTDTTRPNSFQNIFTPGSGYELQLDPYDPDRPSTIFTYPTYETNLTRLIRRVYYRVLYFGTIGQPATDSSNVVWVDIRPRANVQGGFTNTQRNGICINATPTSILPINPLGDDYSWYKQSTPGGPYVAMLGLQNLTNPNLPDTAIKTNVAGTFRYRLIAKYGSECSADTAATQVIVTPNNTITLTSPNGTNSQTVCINTPQANITYGTTGATGATFTGLPPGVNGTWASNTVTISGTPTSTGTYSYTVTLTGGCGVISATGSILVNPDNTITLSSGAGTNSQTVCINTAISSLTYTTTGATGATFAGLPAGVSGSWLNNVVTISGSPSVSGTFNYTITLTGGCNNITATGTIIVNPNNTITLTSIPSTESQTICINTPITDITYSTTGATGATITNLPPGLTGSWAANVVTISGTATGTGTYNYVVTLTGGCGVITKTGTIAVRPDDTITLSSAAGTNSQTACINIAANSITYSTTIATNASVTGLPSGMNGSWAGNVFTISGTPTVAGTYTYTVTTTGGCAPATATGTILVNPNNTINLTSDIGTLSQTVCINTGVSTITGITTGATGATFTGLPTGVTGNWAANVVTISGTPTVSGTFNFTITLTGGCGVVTATGRIAVTPDNTITLTSAANTESQTVCISTPITNITYSTTGATNASVTGLPVGVTGNWAANTVTISGTPTVAGSYSYTVTLTGGCGIVTRSGIMTVTAPNTITLSSAAGTNSQTACISTAITSITYSTTGATGASATGLPAGVTGTWTANVFTITGTPTASGTFNYTVTTSGGCGVATATGTLLVNPNNTITLSSGAGTDSQTICINTAITSITYTTTGATGATITNLPPGLTGSWAANVVTISGTATGTGTFNYVITLTGGCGVITKLGSIRVNPNNTIVLSSAAGTDSQTACINAAATQIRYTTTGATGATVTGLPSGMGGTWSANVVTISGTPTVAGTYTYTVLTTGGCGATTATGTILVNPNNTITLSSAAGTDSQTICINTAITSITYSTTGATGATVTPLPTGVTSSWSNNVLTISGTATQTGTFNYVVTLTGGCGVITATGKIIVTPNNTITLTSAPGTDAQTVCTNSAISTITYSTTGATGATVTGLPAGVIDNWTGNVLRITGTPAAAGSYSYTITLNGGCGVITKTGTINVTALNTITLSSAAGTDSQTLCISTVIPSITYSTTGATNANATGLPAGVTGSWAANVFTISGTPTASGTFTYTVTTIGGCGVATATGTIVVNPNNTITLSSAAGTDSQTICINTAITSITYTTTGAIGATFSSLPPGLTGSWAANVVTISGTATGTGTYNYVITLTGGCGVITKTGRIVVRPDDTITLSSAAGTNSQTACINIAANTITYSTTIATGATVTGLPPGMTHGWAANVVTISGTPTVAGTYTYTVTTTGGCAPATATGTILVNPNNTITLSSVAGTDSQTVCINTAITSITYSTTGATGATFTGLPGGLTGSWAANVVTISGTATQTGTFNYVVTLTGGCGVITSTGRIVVTPNDGITLSSGAGTNVQSVCINTAPTTITYNTTIATNASVTGLPAGMGGTWTANVFTITGTPTVSGTFNYTITTSGGCVPATATGTITVVANNTIALTSAPSSNAQTICISTSLTNITYATTGATNATVSGLPAGLTGNWAANVFTISGSPSVSGSFNYTVTTVGGCGVATATGTLVVTPNNTITLTSTAGTNSQTVCINTGITSIAYSSTGADNASFAGLPTGLITSFSNNIISISGIPTSSGTYNYSVILTGGCGIISATGTIVVNAASVAGNLAITSGSAQICSSGTKPTITLSGNNLGSTILWQYSTDGGATYTNTTPIQTGTSISSVISNSITGTTQLVTYYLAVVKSGVCPSASTSPIAITVDPIPQIVPIAANEKNQQVCIGGTAIDVNLTTNLGTIVWKYSSTSGSGYLPFSPSQTNATLPNSVIATNVAGTTYYRAFVTGGVCSAITSDEVVVRIDPSPVAGNLAITSGSAQICSNSARPTITLSGNTIGTTISWLYSTDGTTYTNTSPIQTGSSISSVINNSAPGTAQVITYYKAEVLSGVCPAVRTSPLSIAVDPIPVITPIANNEKNQVVCINGMANDVNLTTNLGTIVWKYSSTSGSGYLPFSPSQTNSTLLNTVINTNVAGTTYYKAFVSSGVCALVPSDEVRVQVDAATVAGTISSTSSQICNNSAAPTISLTGNTGSTIVWQYSTNGGATYTNTTPLQTGTSISSVINNSAPANSQVTTYYKAIVQNGVCPNQASNAITVTVDPTSQAGLLLPAQKTQVLCIGNAASDVVLPSYVGTIIWQTASSLAGTYTTIGGQTLATLPSVAIPTNVAGTKYYKAVVTSGVCPSYTSEIASIQVDAGSVAGTISSTSTQICNNSAAPTISLTGNTGSNILWQYSVDGGATYTNTTPIQTGTSISSVINNSAPTNLQVTTYYKAIVQNGVCPNQSSNAISVSVDPSSQVTPILPAQTAQVLCIGSPALDVVLPSYVGTIVWQTASSLAGTYTTIVGQTLATLPSASIPTNVAGTKYYKAVVKSGVCPITTSDIASVQVDAASVGGTISSTSSQICNNSAAPTISLTGNTGSTIVWQYSVDAGATYTNTTPLQTGTSISSVINNSAPGTVQVTTYYKAIVQNGVCPNQASNAITIKVDPTSQAGIILPAQKVQQVCIGNAASDVVLPSYVGTIIWQTASTLAGTYTTIGGQTLATLPSASIPTNVAGTKYYKAVVTSGVCPSYTSEIASVQVDAASVGGTISSTSSQICNNSAAPTISLTGNTGSTIVWQYSVDAGATYTNTSPLQTGTSISSVINNSAPGNLQVTTYYKAIVQNGVCPNQASNAITIKVDPTSQAGIILPAQKVQQVCIGNAASDVVLPSYVGTIIWQTASTLAGTYTTIGGQTSATLPSASIPTNVAGTKYYKAVVTSGVCPSYTSEIASVQVDALTVAGTISSTSGLICNNSPSPTISLTGNTGNTIVWQYSTNGGATYTNTTPIQTGTSINSVVNNSAPGTVQVTTYYKAIVQNGVCPNQVSNAITVSVDPTSQVDPILPAQKLQEVCSGNAALDIVLPNHVGTIIWQIATSPLGSYTTIGGQTAATLPNAVILTNAPGIKYYKAVVTSGVCPSIDSDIARVQVYAATVAGSISSTSGLICNNSPSPTITLTGNTGNNIIWQYSVDGGSTYTNTSPIQNGTSINSVVNNSAPGSVQVVTYYKAIVQSGVCPSLVTNAVSVSVDPTSQVGNILPAQKTQQVCIGSPALDVVLPTNVGTIIWQTASAALGTYTTIGGQTLATLPNAFIPTNVAGTKYYKAVVTSGVCPSINSEIVSVQTDPLTVAGTIASSSILICNNSAAPTISLTGNTGNTIIWQYSTDGGATYTNTSPIQNGTSINSVVNNRAPGSVQVVTYYKAIVQSGVCPSLTTNDVSVGVDPSSQIGPIAAVQKDQEVCIGSPAVDVFVPSYVGTLVWKTSNNANGGFLNMSGQTNPLLPYTSIPTNVAGTMYYKAVVTSGVCPSVESDLVSVQTDAASVAGNIFFANGSSPICNQGVKPTISLSDFVGNNIIWQTSPSSTNALTGAALAAINYVNTTQTGKILNSAIDNTTSVLNSSFRYYRAEVKNGVCPSVLTSSVEIEVIPTPLITSTIAAERCGPGSVQLNAVTNLGVVNWFENATGGTSLNNGNDFMTPSVNSTTNFYASGLFRGCYSLTRTPVLSTIKIVPTITSVSDSAVCGPAELGLSAKASAGLINWYANSMGGNSILAGDQFKTPLIRQTTVYYVDATLDGCTTVTRSPVRATIYVIPQVSIIADTAQVCVGNPLSFSNNAFLGLPPYVYTIYLDNDNVIRKSNESLLGARSGYTTAYFNVKDMNGCVSLNSNAFKIKVSDPVAPQNFFYQAYYKEDFVIPTKIDTGYILYNWNPPVNLNFIDKPNPTFNGENTTDYTLIRTDTTSKCTVADNYHIDVTKDFIFDLPNAFTPNYDGQNDKIKVIANAGIKEINSLKFFNRAGLLVKSFSNLTEGRDGWDGLTLKGMADTDGYYWIAEYETKDGRKMKKSGSFILLK